MSRERIALLGDWLRIVHVANSGILFGMLPQTRRRVRDRVGDRGRPDRLATTRGPAGASSSRSRSALLLGGALGNLLDRLRYGSVVDFVDMGIGAWRFYTYNLADAAISTSIVLLVVMAVVPAIGDWAADG